MKQLRQVDEIKNNTDVILRMDTDLPIEDGKILDNSRLVKSLPTIKLLLDRHCKIVIMGHMGRPKGFESELSLRIVYLELMKLLEGDGVNNVENIFVNDVKNESDLEKAINENQIVFLENLRFWTEEEMGDTSLFSELKKFCFVYINDAFAVAHRKSASILLFKEMETYYGLSFVEEAEKIQKVLECERPVTVVLGGAKEDKLKYLTELSEKADYVLIGGKLPRLRPAGYDGQSKIIWAELNKEGLDLSEKDIDKFKEIIVKSKTIIWAGAMGLYESEDFRKGTEEVAREIANNNNAYKIIAGGDTGASIVNLGLKDRIDFICSGGGVMLEFLAKGTLPAWE